MIQNSPINISLRWSMGEVELFGIILLWCSSSFAPTNSFLSSFHSITGTVFSFENRRLLLAVDASSSWNPMIFFLCTVFIYNFTKIFRVLSQYSQRKI